MALRPTRPQNRNEQLAERDALQKNVLLREVDDALREDQVKKAFRRHALTAGAVIIVALAALGGYLLWRNHGDTATEDHARDMTLALDSIEKGDLDGGAKALAALTGTGQPAQQAVARLMAGGVALQQGRKDDAVKNFLVVASDPDVPEPLRDLALVRHVATTFDSMPPAEVVARLKPLAVPGNPFYGSAGELVAFAYLKQNRPDLAGPLFAAISKDRQVPRSLRSRTQQMAGILGVDAIEDTGAANAAPNADTAQDAPQPMPSPTAG